MIPSKPEKFDVLCHRYGLAVLLGQKVQVSLAIYFGVYHAVRAGWDEEKVDKKIRSFLSNTMGVVVGEIKKYAPLPGGLSKKIDTFKSTRNWLVHDFDEEATPYITRGQKIDHYITKMEQIWNDAQEIMIELDTIGDDLMMEKGVTPETIRELTEKRLQNE